MISVRQTDSALFNLSMNTHGNVEVPKSKKKMSVSCNQPLYDEIFGNKDISKLFKRRQN